MYGLEGPSAVSSFCFWLGKQIKWEDTAAGIGTLGPASSRCFPMVISPLLFPSVSVDDSQQHAPSASLMSDTPVCTQRGQPARELTQTANTIEVYKCSLTL